MNEVTEMDCRTGDIVRMSNEKMEEISSKYGTHYVPVPEREIPKLTKMSKPRRKNYMRNKPCPCKSGKKFKNCCWSKYSS
jgi:uncharacterized protein YecA (UPF0149 family)